ncbi:MAG: hypothetical protein LBH43_04380 [Treponema sp.]|nr:hypothetical protein [Treponema sp.]
MSLRTFYRWEKEFSSKGLDGLTPRYSAGSARAGGEPHRCGEIPP